MLGVIICLMSGVTVLDSAAVNKIGSNSSLWYLAMNLNPSDGHIMDYTTGLGTRLFARATSVNIRSRACLFLHYHNTSAQQNN